MINEWVERLMATLSAPEAARLAPEIGLQVAAFLLLLFAARLLVPLWTRLVTRFGRIAGPHPIAQLTGLVPPLLLLLSEVAWPLLAWLLGLSAIALFDTMEWEAGLLHWLVPFLLAWLLYRTLVHLAVVRFGPERAEQFRRQIVRPLLVVATLLYAVGWLDDLLNWGVGLPDNRITFGAIVGALLVLYLFVLLSRGSRNLLQQSLLPGAGLEPALTQVLATFFAYGVIMAGVATALGVAGISLTALTVILGGLSVGLGFGLQEIVSNFFSGFILLFEGSIAPGQVIQIGEVVGQVDDIGIRSTRVKTTDNVELIVPNSHFLSDVVTNFTRGDTQVRLRVKVGVSYQADPREVEAALLEAAAPFASPSLPDAAVLFTDFGDSSLNFELQLWTEEAYRIPSMKSRLRYLIWDALAARQIEIPFPQRDIHIRSVVDGATLPGPS